MCRTRAVTVFPYLFLFLRLRERQIHIGPIDLVWANRLSGEKTRYLQAQKNSTHGKYKRWFNLEWLTCSESGGRWNNSSDRRHAIHSWCVSWQESTVCVRQHFRVFWQVNGQRTTAFLVRQLPRLLDLWRNNSIRVIYSWHYLLWSTGLLHSTPTGERSLVKIPPFIGYLWSPLALLFCESF